MLNRLENVDPVEKADGIDEQVFVLVILSKRAKPRQEVLCC